MSFILLAIYIGNVSVNILDGHLTAHDATMKSVDSNESYPAGRSLAILGLSGIALAVVSEAVTESLIPATRTLGFSDTFSGIVLLGGVGGIGEVLTASSVCTPGKTRTCHGSNSRVNNTDGTFCGAAARVYRAVFW